ncbi:MAG TPA: MYXO-CTERM sorting domain-containing protein, partial [Polyangia bacterium]
IASGNCVFAEYQSFITIDYDPATVPNTAASSVVHTFHLAPMTGGAAQTFVYTGGAPFPGLAPSGAYPLPLGQWQPDLDPTRQYCLSISAFGDGDLARPMLSSNQVCAAVTQLSATGAPPPPGITGAAPGGGGCGCSAAGAPDLNRPVSLAATILIGLSLATRRPRSRR